MIRTLTLVALGLVAIAADAQVPAEGEQRPGRADTAGRGVAPEIYQKNYYRSGVANRGHRPDCAAAYFTLAIRAEPRMAAAYEARADLWAAEGWPERALTDYTEAIRLRPGADLYRRRAEVRPEKDLDGKITDYTEAIRLDPRMSTAYEGRAEALDRKGEIVRVEADLSEVIRLRPGDASAYTARAMYWPWKGPQDRAIADYSEAIRLAPERERARLYGLRAMRRREAGRQDEAIDDYTAESRLDPANPTPYFGLARCHLDRGDADAALTDLAAASRLGAPPELVHRMRAQAWRAKGDVAQAEVDAREAARLEAKAPRPDPPPALGAAAEGKEAVARRAARLASWDKGMAAWGPRYAAWEAAMTAWDARIEAWKRSDMLQSPPPPPDGPPDPPRLPESGFRRFGTLMIPVEGTQR